MEWHNFSDSGHIVPIEKFVESNFVRKMFVKFTDIITMNLVIFSWFCMIFDKAIPLFIFHKTYKIVCGWEKSLGVL